MANPTKRPTSERMDWDNLALVAEQVIINNKVVLSDQVALVSDPSALTAAAPAAITAVNPSAVTAVALTGSLTGTLTGALTDVTFNATWSQAQANQIQLNDKTLQDAVAKLITDAASLRTQLTAAIADVTAARTQVAALVVDLTAARTKQIAILAVLSAHGLMADA